MAVLGADYYTEAFTATMEKFDRKKLVDQVLLRHPILDLLRKKAKADSGRLCVIPLEAAENESTGFTNASGAFDTGIDGDIMGASTWEWSSPLVSKSRLQWLELEKNSGTGKIVDLMQAHIAAATKGHAKYIAARLHARADVAGQIVAGQFTALDQLVSDATYDAAQGFTIGGIDPGGDTDHYWQALRIEENVATGLDIRKAFRRVANDLYEANASGEPDVIICGRDIYDEYEDSFDEKVRYTSINSEVGQTRFRELRFENMIVRLDPDCPPKRAYFLDSDTLHFRYLNSNFMKAMERQKITGTFDYVVPLASIMSIGVSERRRNAVLLRPDTAGGDA